MVPIVLCIPFLALAVLFLFFPDYAGLWGIVTVLGGSLLVTLLTWWLCTRAASRSKEILTGFVTSVKHYEAWNERVMRTRQVPVTDRNGHTTYKTETYYEVVYHPDQWTYTNSLSRWEGGITRELFNRCRRRFNTPMIWVDMHRPYHTIDGDCEVYCWDGSRPTFIPYSKTHRYRNPLRNSNSILRRQPNGEERKALADLLLEKPKHTGFYHPSVVGLNVRNNDIDYVNALYGEQYQIRVQVYLFGDNVSHEMANMQINHLRGGEKNEFIVCMSVSSSGKPNWVECFSWSEAPDLEVRARQYLLQQSSLSLYDFSNWLLENIPQYWKRREFKTFRYVRVTLPLASKIIMLIVSLLAAALALYLTVTFLPATGPLHIVESL